MLILHDYRFRPEAPNAELFRRLNDLVWLIFHKLILMSIEVMLKIKSFQNSKAFCIGKKQSKFTSKSIKMLFHNEKAFDKNTLNHKKGDFK